MVRPSLALARRQPGWARAPVWSTRRPVAVAKLKDDRHPIIDLVALWRPVRKYWITTLMIAIATAVGAGFWTMGQTKIYEASATVQFDPNPPRPLGNKVDTVVEMGSGAVWDTRDGTAQLAFGPPRTTPWRGFARGAGGWREMHAPA